MLEQVLTSLPVRRIVASLPRGGGRVSRLISKRYPRAQVYHLVGALAQNRMHLNTADPFQAEMAYGAYQCAVIDKMIELTRPGDVVLTAGAQLGYVTLALANAVGPTGRVLAFEVDPKMLAECRRNLELNPFEATVDLLPVGLGSVNQELEMAISSTAGQSSLAIGHHKVESIPVPIRLGDDVLAELGISKLDGIVLDVEGWETHALQGLSRTLENHLPRWAIVECWDEALRGAGSSANSLLHQLQNFGWNTGSISGGPLLDGDDIVCTQPATANL